MKLFRAAITSAVFLAIGALSYADPAPDAYLKESGTSPIFTLKL